jgi:hypothetical protein
VDTEVDTGKAKGNDKGRKERNSPMNPNRHEQGLGQRMWKIQAVEMRIHKSG